MDFHLEPLQKDFVGTGGGPRAFQRIPALEFFFKNGLEVGSDNPIPLKWDDITDIADQIDVFSGSKSSSILTPSSSRALAQVMSGCLGVTVMAARLTNRMGISFPFWMEAIMSEGYAESKPA
jgi:hypothetical protein